MLEHHADFQACLTQRFSLRGGDILTVNGDAAGAGLFQTVQQTDQRTFPGPAVTDDPVNLSLFYRQVDVIYGCQRLFPVVKNLRNIAEYNHSYSLSVSHIAV